MKGKKAQRLPNIVCHLRKPAPPQQYEKREEAKKRGGVRKFVSGRECAKDCDEDQLLI
jgi:hypothetical protein